MLNPQEYLSNLDWGIKWHPHWDDIEHPHPSEQPILSSELTAASRLRVTWNIFILLIFCYIFIAIALIYQKTEASEEVDIQKPLTMFLLSVMLNAECLELVFVHTYMLQSEYGVNKKWVMSTVCSSAAIILLQFLEPSLSLRAKIALLTCLSASSAVAVTSFVKYWAKMYSFIYLFIHTSLVCMLFSTFSRQTKIELFRLREYFLMCSLLCSLLITIGRPLLKRKIKQALPLILILFTNGGLMALGRSYPQMLSTERRSLILNISAASVCALCLYQANLSKDKKFTEEEVNNPVYEGLTISVAFCVSIMLVFNLSTSWRLLMPHEKAVCLIQTENITESYWLKMLYMAISSKSLILTVMYSSLLALVLCIFIVRSPLYYCALNYSDRFFCQNYPWNRYYGPDSECSDGELESDSECTSEKIQTNSVHENIEMLEEYELVEHSCQKIIVCDIFLLYLYSTLASFNPPESINFILYFIATLSGSVATLAILSTWVEIHFGICYQLAHIGLVYISMSSNQNQDGSSSFGYNDHFIWISLLSNLICFIPKNIEPLALSIVVVPFIAVFWEQSQAQSKSLYGGALDVSGPIKGAIWFSVVYLTQFLRDFSPKLLYLGIFRWISRLKFSNFSNILSIVILSVMNYIISSLWYYLAT